jgi:hypothetical protein
LPIAALLSIATGIAIFGFMLIFSLVSFQEEKSRAAIRALMFAFFVTLPYFVIALIDFELREIVCYLQ